MTSAARVERVVTSGIFSLDGEDFEVDNNIWLVGDDDEVLVVDAAHDAGPIADAVGGRRVVAIVCTHGHNDHVNAAVALSERTGAAPIAIHGDDRFLWDVVHPDRAPDRALSDGDALEVAGVRLTVHHTPGHSPGGVCLVASELGTVFSGDTLFHGGPGATGRSFSDKATLLASIERELLGLPGETVVRTGHGDDTTIAAERAAFEAGEPNWRL
jgi:glyoxylase-like metal-dependent hydrolase (beta-lactamase superfamily II)